MVHVPKQRSTYCKKEGKHTVHKITQIRKGQDNKSTQGWRRYYRKQAGFGGQTRPIFRKKAKTTKKVHLRLECTKCKARKLVVFRRSSTFDYSTDATKKAKSTPLTW